MEVQGSREIRNQGHKEGTLFWKTLTGQAHPSTTQRLSEHPHLCLANHEERGQTKLLAPKTFEAVTTKTPLNFRSRYQEKPHVFRISGLV